MAPTEKNSRERPPETQLWKSAFPLPAGEADVAVQMVQGDVCSGTGTRVYTLKPVCTRGSLTHLDFWGKSLGRVVCFTLPLQEVQCLLVQSAILIEAVPFF